MIKTAIILILTLIVVPIVSYFSGDSLSALQVSILWNCIYIYVVVALISFITSQITGNCSQVDKIWSIMPVVYSWYIANEGGMGARLVLMAVLVSIWGIRLTYNFARKGGYSLRFWGGTEDYRWEILRQKPELNGKIKWFFFNLFFISFYQNGLILLFTLPILVAVNGYGDSINWLECLAAGLFSLFVIIETIADQQQWNYQQEKYRRIKSGEKLTGIYEQGFVHSGLWKYMRHPNYMAEQAIWICFYFIGVAANGEWINWSIAGCLLLLVLFQGSSGFSESISMGKYPQYAEYMKKTGRFILKFKNQNAPKGNGTF
jgi:steroid 5-alpha reductase family enzyme